MPARWPSDANVEIVLAAAHARLAALQLPPMPHNRLRDAARFALEDQIDQLRAKVQDADKKIAVLTRVDTHLQNVIQKLGDWLNGKSSDSSSSSSSDSALDQAAAGLSQAAAGSNG